MSDLERASLACRMALEGLRRYGAATMGGTSTFRRWTERADTYAAPESFNDA
jgi:hypothetical protein